MLKINNFFDELIGELQKDTITCIEWSEHAEPIMKAIRSNSHVIEINMRHKSEHEREIEVITNTQ